MLKIEQALVVVPDYLLQHGLQPTDSALVKQIERVQCYKNL